MRSDDILKRQMERVRKANVRYGKAFKEAFETQVASREFYCEECEAKPVFTASYSFDQRSEGDVRIQKSCTHFDEELEQIIATAKNAAQLARRL